MKKLYFLLVIFTVIVLSVFYACRKEKENTFSNNTSFTLQQAQNWYVQNSIAGTKSTVARRNKDILSTLGIKPAWQNMQRHHFSNGIDMMEIPLATTYNFSYRMIMGELDTSLYNQQGLLPVKQALRLLLAKDSNGIIRGAIMEIIGSKDYLKARNQQLNRNNFLLTDSTFSGMVIFFQYPGGQFIRGYRYVDGIQLGNVYKHESIDSTVQAKEEEAVCLIAVPWYYSVCDGSYCTYGIGGYDYYEFDCGGGGGGGGGSLPPDDDGNIPPNYPVGGGAGGGGSTPSLPPPAIRPLPENVEAQIQNQPFALLYNVPCDSIKQWLSIATYQPSDAIISKLQTVYNEVTLAGTAYDETPITYDDVAHVQDINDAYSEVVNMDYFSVKVNTLPVVNGMRLTADQFLQYIRTNINSFVNTNISTFTPYKYGSTNDTNLWNSANPIGAIVSIDIFLNDGSVITSYSSNNKWTFTTIHDPLNGEHPVSGNRNFGYTTNADGSYTFYTQGVDRLTDWITDLANSKPLKIPFNNADALWESFQTDINNFVIGHNGSSIIQSPLTYRPNWSTVKAVIDGVAPLSTLSKLCP